MRKIRQGKIFPYLLAAFGLTLVFTVYMRVAGPNHPHRFKLSIDGIEYKLKLPKTWTTDTPFELNFELGNTDVSAVLHYRLYPGERPWETVPMLRENGNLIAELPILPTAGKYAYWVSFDYQGEVQYIKRDKPMIIRYNDPVPGPVLLAHVLSMVIATFFSWMVTLLTIRNHRSFKKYTFLSLFFLTLGGMILGPIVQKYAFGEYWTGVPFGMDLTDNKTLIVWLVFLYAVIANIRKNRPFAALVASVLFIIINLIPHSMFGSELDPETGKIIQG